MIDSLLVLRQLIQKLFNYKHQLTIQSKQVKKLADYELTSDDWNVLLVLYSILKPFYHATKVMSGRRYPSIGVAFYVLTRLKNFLQQNHRKESLMEKRLKQLLLKQFLHYFESDDEQMELLKSNEQGPFCSDTTTTNSPNKTNSTGNLNKSAIDIFNESIGDIHYEESRRGENTRATIVNEFQNYRKYATQFNLKHKPDATSAIIFWRTYGDTFSILRGLAKKMLSTPATSVPSESCFSLSSSLGTVIAGGNGHGNCLDRLYSSRYVFVDQYHSVYVSYLGNHRVMKWMEGAKEGIVLAGGQGEGNALTRLHFLKDLLSINRALSM
ncbi:unnamed protein product [Rotaria magnacalcarata]|uniref:HAT C-terminal dimerisation domain-containing protein n=1 Tax=Rotaria magnacalcarata TaxID=392030 RepID=A0A819MQZ9_9BILA|nr:unnamed protein product [Rotaria magnacalcarata]